MLGYGFGGSCFDSAALAQAAFYSAQTVATNGSATQTTTYHTFNGTAWQRIVHNCSGSPVVCTSLTQTAPAFTPFSCTLIPTDDPVTQFTDGHLLGWGVVAAMVAAWGITVLRRAAI